MMFSSHGQRNPPHCTWRMGFIKKILQAGSGATPTKGSTVTVHCTGYVTANNYKFWSTKDPGQKVFAFTIGVGQVIKGWDEGVMGMQVGETSQITCSPDYAYGANGFPAWKIPPSAELMFEIELLSIQ